MRKHTQTHNESLVWGIYMQTSTLNFPRVFSIKSECVCLVLLAQESLCAGAHLLSLRTWQPVCQLPKADLHIHNCEHIPHSHRASWSFSELPSLVSLPLFVIDRWCDWLLSMLSNDLLNAQIKLSAVSDWWANYGTHTYKKTYTHLQLLYGTRQVWRKCVCVKPQKSWIFLAPNQRRISVSFCNVRMRKGIVHENWNSLVIYSPSFRTKLWSYVWSYEKRKKSLTES